ncbi:serine hydrolase [Bacillus sp. SL00103]
MDAFRHVRGGCEKDEVVYQKGFGYADRKKKKQVTASTFFEIGSTSKAFTALAIVELEKQGKLHVKIRWRLYSRFFQHTMESLSV